MGTGAGRGVWIASRCEDRVGWELGSEKDRGRGTFDHS
jgi:hypothetical protein